MTEAEYMQSLIDTWAEHWQSGEPITFSAQQYGQRHYTEKDQQAAFNELLEEARKVRDSA